MKRPNFTECAATFLQNQTLIDLYGWKGPVVGIPSNANTQISVQGCREICGEGVETYPWRQIADTITTWVLPSVGVVVQAPFESNRNLNNVRSPGLVSAHAHKHLDTQSGQMDRIANCFTDRCAMEYYRDWSVCHDGGYGCFVSTECREVTG